MADGFGEGVTAEEISNKRRYFREVLLIAEKYGFVDEQIRFMEGYLNVTRQPADPVCPWYDRDNFAGGTPPFGAVWKPQKDDTIDPP